VLVARIAFAGSADFGKAEINVSELNAFPVKKLIFSSFLHFSDYYQMNKYTY